MLKTQNSSSKLFFKAIFSFSSTFNHWYGWKFYITLDWRVLLFEICSMLQSRITSFRQRLWVHLRDKYCRLTFLVSFGRFNFFRHVPICTFRNKKRWCWCGRGVSVSSCDWWARSMFLMIFLRNLANLLRFRLPARFLCPRMIISTCFTS